MQKPQVATIAVLSTAETETLLVAPHGLDEIITAFGNIYDDVGKDGQLEALSTDSLERVALPFPLRLSWDLSRT
jgi:hypothetical protein